MKWFGNAVEFDAMICGCHENEGVEHGLDARLVDGEDGNRCAQYDVPISGAQQFYF